MVFEKTVPGFKCSHCDFVSTRQGDVVRHIYGSRHNTADIEDCEASFVCYEDTEPRPIEIRNRPRRPRYVAKYILQTRVPTCDLEPRIDHVFDGIPPDELTRQFTTETVPSIMIWLFSQLWGSRAPEKFQSIVASGPIIYELCRRDPCDMSSVAYIESHTAKRDLTEDMVSRVYRVLKTICTNHIPVRRPDLLECAANILKYFKEIREHDVTLMDVVVRSPRYMVSHRKLTKEFKNVARTVLRCIFDEMHTTRAELSAHYMMELHARLLENH